MSEVEKVGGGGGGESESGGGGQGGLRFKYIERHTCTSSSDDEMKV